MENMKRLFPADESIVYCQSGEEAIGNSEIVLITTEWKEFARFDFQGKQIFEGKRVFDAQKRKELNVEGICW
jgi:UDP-glucose 6-dehydrogenase